ncbi:Ig-like domain (group 2), partial [Filimonas lacunae]
MYKTLNQYLYRLILPVLLSSVCLINIASAQGYIYVHLRALNEESSVDFPFTVTGGLTSVAGFSLNDQPSIVGPITDLGVGHGSSTLVAGGDGELWAIVGGALYKRMPGQSSWALVSVTGSGTVLAVDGAGPGSCVYTTTTGNAYYYSGGTSKVIFTYNASSSNRNSKAVDITYGDGRIAVLLANGNIWANSTTVVGAYTDSWTSIQSGTGPAAIDMLPSSGKIAYYNSSNSRIYIISYTGTNSTNLGTPGGTDVCFDDEGNIYSTGYKWVSGTTWTTDATRGSSFKRVTGGAGNQIWCNETIDYTAKSIFTREPYTGTWIDDERVRTDYKDNSILIPVTAGTYTLNIPDISGWSLSEVELYDPSNNSSSSIPNKKVTFNVASGEVVHAVLHVNKLISLSVAKTCQLSAVDDFGSAASAPVNITSYHYLNRARLEDGYYSIQNNTSGWDNDTLKDHTDRTGNFMIINSSYQKDEFYRKRLINLEVGQVYVMSFWVANLSPGATILPNITAAVADIDGNILSSVTTGDVSNRSWTQYTFEFTATATTQDVYLKNNAFGGGGNDLALDDISIAPKVGTIESSIIAGNPVYLCSGNDYNMSNSAAGGVWSSSNSSVASINSSTGVLSAIAGGTATITYKITSNLGCTATTTSNVEVKASPVVTATVSSNNICIGNTVTLGGSATSGRTPYTILWSATPSTGAGLGATATYASSAKPTATGSYAYALKVTDANSCATTAQQTVVVDAIPTATISYGQSSYCAIGSVSVTKTGNGLGTGTYSAAPAGLSIDATTGAINLGTSTAGNYTITYNMVNGACTASATTTLTVLPAKEVSDIGGDVGLCTNTTGQLTNSVSGGVWSNVNNANIATVNASTGVISAGGGTGSTTVRYTYTVGTCTSYKEVQVNVGSPNTGTISPTTAVGVCAGSSVTLYPNSSNGGGTWTSSNTNIATVNNGTVIGVSGGVATMSFTTNNNGCVTVKTKDVTVTPKPVVSIDGPDVLCTSSTAMLTGTPFGGTWTSTNSNIISVNATTGEITGANSNNSSSTLTYTYTENGCTNSASQVITLRTGNSNLSNNSPTSASICVGATRTVTNSSNVVDYFWSSTNPNVATVSASGVVTGVAQGSATIYYSAQRNNLNCFKSANTAITVLATPTVSAISGDTDLCLNKTATLTATPSGGTWSSSSTSVATISSAGLLTAKAVGSSTITYTVSNGTCSASSTTTAIVGALPTVNAITPSGTSTICQGATVQLANTTSGGAWTSSDESIATVTAGGLVNGVRVGAATITYTLSSSNGGCSNSVTKAITVNALPTAVTISYGNTAFCKTGSALVKRTGDTTNINSLYSSTAGLAGDASIGRIDLAGSTPGSYWIKYQYTDKTTGCSDTTGVGITINPLPTAITISYGNTSFCKIGSAVVKRTGDTSNITSLYSSTAGLVGDISTGTVDLAGSSAGSYWIKYQYTNKTTGCSDTTGVGIKINALPAAVTISYGNTVF